MESRSSPLLDPSYLLDEVEFRETFRGYDRNQVDSFLEQLAAALGELRSRAAAAEQRAQEAERRVADGGGQPARTLLMAQRAAEATLREAREEAARLRREATTPADEAVEEDRRTLRAEVATLEAAHQARTEEIARLDEQIAEQRVRLRSLVEAVDRLLVDQQRAPAAPEPTEEIEVTEAAAGPAPDEPELCLDLRRVDERAVAPDPDSAIEADAEADEEVVDLRQPWELPAPPPAGRGGRRGVRQHQRW